MSIIGGRPYDFYIEGNGMQRLDPRTKGVVLACTLVLVLFIFELYTQIALCIIFIFAWIASGIPKERHIIISPVYAYCFFIFITSIILIKRGTVIFEFPPPFQWLTVTSAALYETIIMDLRIINLALYLYGMIQTTRKMAMLVTARMFGLKYKFASVASLILIFFPAIVSALLSIAQAQRCRGLDLTSGGIIARLKKSVGIMGPSLRVMIRLMALVPLAMQSRGFGAYPERTYIDHYELKIYDKIIIGASIAGTAIIIILAWIYQFYFWQVTGYTGG